jgi:hypothetical protein
MFAEQQKSAEPINSELEEDVSREDIVAAFRTAMVNHFRSHIPGTNINESTLLASDYLNHFHELVMLIEALASAPDDFADDLAAWRPVTYEEHFTSSGFRDKNLAIAAYRRAPLPVREAFDAAVARLHDEAVALIATLRRELQSQSRAGLASYCDAAATRLRVLIETANAIAIGAPIPQTAARETAGNGQDAIDALFDPR